MATGELAEVVVEEVATNLEEAAVAVRLIDTKAVGFMIVGLGVGLSVGFFIGYRYNREKLRAEAFRQSEEEVDKIREMYRESRVIESPKPDLEEIVEERGYSTTGKTFEEKVRPLKPPVPVLPDASVEPIVDEKKEKDKDTDWSYPYELSQRSPNTPYIIHQDEFFGDESGYPHVTYTYYVGDDILADEDETVLNNRVTLIGPAEHLTRFGHGADDPNSLYIRNSHLEIEIEIVRDPGTYRQEVQGLEDETRNETDGEPA